MSIISSLANDIAHNDKITGISKQWINEKMLTLEKTTDFSMIPHVHIEYHNQDKEFAETLTHILRKNDICVQCAAYNNNSNYKEHVESLLKENDSIIWILIKNYRRKKVT